MPIDSAACKQVSRQMAALFRELVGRGPRLTRTYSEENLVVVLLGDTMTKAERMLADEDRVDLVREMRRNWQTAIGERVTGAIEEISGRAVYAVLSDHSVLPDYATLAFVLEPRADKQPDRGPEQEPKKRDGDAAENSSVSRTHADRGRQREISRGMVSLFKKSVGRGPTSARTYFHDDLVITLLEDTLTTAEKTLADEDREALVREVRRQFQGALRERAVELVEQHTGSTVKAFLSDNSVFPDYALELFVLERHTEGEHQAARSEHEAVPVD